MTFPRTLQDQMAELYRRLGEIERRNRNRRRTGTVAEVNDDGTYRVKLAEQDGREYKTGWIRPRQLGAGNVKFDVVLKQGEQVDVVSENGDMTDAMIEMSAYSNDNARANGSNVPLHIRVGENVTIEVSGNEATVTAPKVVVNSPDVSLGAEGGPAVARIGDRVLVSAGSSAGLWPIVEGSGRVTAAD
jgi:phage baseplate assembly protein gpV